MSNDAWLNVDWLLVVPLGPTTVSPEHAQSTSEKKWQELLCIIKKRFSETSHLAIKSRDELMEGNVNDDEHILSLHMMKTYIALFWNRCHPQLPILHKPTFTADKTPNLLLLTMVMIGASTLDAVYSQKTRDRAAHLADFLAWHLRLEIFMDPGFRPPAELWVCQTLVILEVYEKMYATRRLHKRAHVHHGATLTLMERGPWLVGKSSPDISSNVSAAAESSSISDFDRWSGWIREEGIRRTVFAAFILDSVHATMFGHSAKKAVYEIHRHLPCDEALWVATSAAEAAQLQISLHANHVKPIKSLNGLNMTLLGQKVHTSPFGRIILMAGLLSIRWHMNQQSLRVLSLGISEAPDGRGKWRSGPLRAYDYWKRDFDEAPCKDGNIFKLGTVFHHLAHMASYAHIEDCQIFAGADRLLGRSVTSGDYMTVCDNMEKWANKASARDAVFYALKFLSQVLVLDDPPAFSNDQPSSGIIDPLNPIL